MLIKTATVRHLAPILYGKTLFRKNLDVMKVSLRKSNMIPTNVLKPTIKNVG
jgi:hypothetical protein